MELQPLILPGPYGPAPMDTPGVGPCVWARWEKSFPLSCVYMFYVLEW